VGYESNVGHDRAVLGAATSGLLLLSATQTH